MESLRCGELIQVARQSPDTCRWDHKVQDSRLFYFKQTEFYVSQTEADNHAVREAACACIAELATKVCAAISCSVPYLY